MKRGFIVASLSLALASCAAYDTKTPSEPIPAQSSAYLKYQQPAANTAPVTFYRDTFMNLKCRMGVYVDGVESLRLGQSEMGTLHIPAGNHVIGVSGAMDCARATEQGVKSVMRSVSATVEANKPLKYRVLYHMQPYGGTGFVITPIP